MTQMKMTKAQKKKFDEILAQQAKAAGVSEEELKQSYGIDTLYSQEEQIYEAQAVLNFFRYRITPLMEKGETEQKFDARYNEWRFKKCEGCGEEFAYAYHYDGVKYCSLDCLEKALAEVGIKLTRNRPLELRWGRTAYPAIVSSSALKTLRSLPHSQSSDSDEPD